MVIITETQHQLSRVSYPFMSVAVHSADSRPENNKTKQTDKLFNGLHATVSIKDDDNVLQQCNESILDLIF